MTIIIGGGRDFNDWNVFKRSLDRVPLYYESVTVLSCHDGACDSMAERFASEKKARCWVFPVSNFIPRADGVRIRNIDIVQAADGAVLFWDGKSPEIEHLVSVLRLARRRFLVFDYYGNVMLNEGKEDDQVKPA